jgi:hypothetical protein
MSVYRGQLSPQIVLVECCFLKIFGRVPYLLGGILSRSGVRWTWAEYSGRGAAAADSTDGQLPDGDLEPEWPVRESFGKDLPCTFLKPRATLGSTCCALRCFDTELISTPMPRAYPQATRISPPRKQEPRGEESLKIILNRSPNALTELRAESRPAGNCQSPSRIRCAARCRCRRSKVARAISASSPRAQRFRDR